MNDDLFAERISQIAATLPYPPTPRLAERQPGRAAAWTGRRLALALATVLLLAAGLLTVPQVRAAVVTFLQIGAIRLQLIEPTPVPPTAPPVPTAAPLVAAGLAEATTLSAAQAAVPFPLLRPAYPADLGPPDQVYLDAGGDTVILVWTEPGRPETVRLALYQMGVLDYGFKMVERLEETTVNGRWAIWLDMPHLFRRANDEMAPWQFVTGNVLIWQQGAVTYRLESHLSLEEARQVAESLRLIE